MKNSFATGSARRHRRGFTPIQFLIPAVAGLSVALLLLTAGSAQAGTLYWDGGTTDIGSNGNGASAGGAGTWNTTLLNWDAGAVPHVAWNSANNDTAVFAGTAGTVTLGTGITVGGLTFSTANYVITNNTLTFGSSGSITAIANATIASVIAGSAGITKTGAGTLTLSGANTFSGGLTISAGTVVPNADAALGAAGRTVTFTGSATFGSGSGSALTFNRPFVLTNSAIVTWSIAANNADSTINGAVTGNGGITIGATRGLILPSTGNTLTGPVTMGSGIYAGSFTVNSLGDAPGAGVITMNPTGYGGTSFTWGPGAVSPLTLNYRQFNIGSPGGTATIQNNNANAANTITINTDLLSTGSGTKTLVLAGSNTGTNLIAGKIVDGGGVVKLRKDGAGIWTLSGANSYSGATTVHAGTLIVSQPTTLPYSTVAVDSGAVLRLDYVGTNAMSDLVLNGVSQGPGFFNRTNAAPYLAGTGTLHVLGNWDTDGDGIPDWWMLVYFGHATGSAGDLSRAQDDPDSDGLTNLQEYQLGTHPKNTDSDGEGLSDGDEVNIYHTNPAMADTDRDGLSDGDEINICHTNPFVADTDGDGVGDWYEVAAVFTSPTNAADKPNIPYPLPKPDGSKGATNKPVKVFILSGQSNMVGMGDVDPIDTPGTLSTIVKRQGKFPDLLDTNGNWAVRSNVFYKGVITATAAGPLQPGQGSGSGTFGPELGFGRVMGYYCNEPVLIIKASQGNRGLFWDILPPGSPRYTNGTTVYAGYGESPNSWTVGGGPSPYGWYAGKQYDDFFLAPSDMGAPAWANATAYPSGCQVRDHGVTYISKAAHTASADSKPGVGLNWATYWNVYTVENVTTVLDNFATQYPQWAAQGFEIAGFVWWQGHWDSQNAYTANRYETNLVNLIKTVRHYYENRYPSHIKTNAPLVVGTMDYDGWGMSGNYLTVANAQLAVGDPVKHPEFAGNVKTVETRGYWRTNGPVMSQWYHEWHNAEDYMLVGDVLGRGMISLLSAGTGSDYSTWTAKYPGANLSDPNGDYDGDGLKNDYERIWGLNPTNAASRNPFTSLSGLATGTFRYTRRTPSLTGYSYTVWTSTNLMTWTQDTGAVQTPGAPLAEVETVTVNLSPPLLSGPRLFVRVRAGQ